MRAILAALAMTCALTAYSEAACSTSKLAGKWRLSSDASTCVVTVSSSGKVSSGPCRDYYDNATTKITGGKISVSSSCKVTGSIQQGYTFTLYGWMDASMNFGMGSLTGGGLGTHPAMAIRLP